MTLACMRGPWRTWCRAATAECGTSTVGATSARSMAFWRRSVVRRASLRPRSRARRSVRARAWVGSSIGPAVWTRVRRSASRSAGVMTMLAAWQRAESIWLRTCSRRMDAPAASSRAGERSSSVRGVPLTRARTRGGGVGAGAGARCALVVQEVSSVRRRMPAARMQDGMGGVMAERAALVRAGRGDYPAPVKSV